MNTSELLKKVRKIEIKAIGLSREVFAGQYHSAFKGRGMAFQRYASISMGMIFVTLIGMLLGVSIVRI